MIDVIIYHNSDLALAQSRPIPSEALPETVADASVPALHAGASLRRCASRAALCAAAGSLGTRLVP